MSRLLLVFIVLIVIGAGIALLPFPMPLQQPTQKTIHIEASQYAFSPGEFHVNPGDQVTLELVSTDVVHGLYIDDYGLSVQADPGQVARLTFKADQSGMFRVRCNVTCGAMHPFMIGKLYVGQNLFLYRIAALSVLAVFGLSVMWRWSKSQKIGGSFNWN